MKDFIEQLKLYKEYILAMIAIVSGCLFVANYFATKDALASTQATLNKLIDERECWLNNRITITEISAAIANLERQKIERTSLKIDILVKLKDGDNSTAQISMREQLSQVTKDMERIDTELKGYRITYKIVSDNLFNRTCAQPK